MNRLRVQDAALDGHSADRASAVVIALRVSVADAHLAAVLETADGPVTVLTSDVDDTARIAAHVGVNATVVAF